MGEPVLLTERLEWRLPQLSDAPLLFRHLNSEAEMEHLGGPKTLLQIEEKLVKSLASFASNGFGFMLMFERDTSQLVGHAGLKLVDSPNAHNPGDMEAGWVVREDRWRRGYGLEAVQAVLHHAFANHAAPLVVALTSQRNEPSWRLMQKLGMTRAPELDFVDPAFPPEDNPTILYRLTREDYEAKQ